MSINKNHNKEIEDIFSDDFEVTYEDDIGQMDLQLDGYKDVLSVLSELDETGSMDYLEANRTRTIDLGNYFEDSIGLDVKPSNTKHKGFSDHLSDLFKKHD